MATEITHTLEVYDAAGTSVEFSVSSIAGDTLPYLADDPTGDGQEFDPLTGQSVAGVWRGRIVDAITSGTDRVITARLEDATFRQQLMRRKARLKRTEDGATTVVLCAGRLTRLTLVGEIEYEYQVTDQTRIQSDVKLFAPRSATLVVSANAAAGATSLSCDALAVGVPKGTVLNFGSGKIAITSAAADPSDTSVSVAAIPLDIDDGDQATYREGVADFFDRWPNRGCVFGGPVTGGFLDLPERGGWVFRIAKNDTGVFGPMLQFLSGYGPPDFSRTLTDINHESLARATNERVGPWTGRGGVDANGIADSTITQVTTFDQAERSGFANDLVIEVRSAIGWSAISNRRYGFYLPGIFGITLGENLPSLIDLGHLGKGGAPAGVWLKGMTAVQYAASGLPAYGTTVRARAFTVSPSELSPIYIDDHPVTIIATALTELGRTYDATSATDLIGVLGADLRYRDRITEPPNAEAYLTMLQGAFGIGLRMADDGDLEFFATRLFENTVPAVEVTADDVASPDESDAGPIFSITEQSAIAKVVVEFKSITRVPTDVPDRPPDGIFVRPIKIERKNGDPGVVGDRVHTWRLSGMVSRLGSYKPDMNYFDVPIRELFDRFGRGVIECGLSLLRGGAAGDVNIGDEIVVTLPQLPNKNKRYGDDNAVGGRAMQIVRLTKEVWGAVAKLIDSGPNEQPYGTAPTISIAQSSDYPNTVAELTITNAGTLNAAGAGARVRMATIDAGGSAPSSTDYADVIIFPPGQIPTGAFPLPQVAQGREVYAKARAEVAGVRPSSYSSAADVALDAYTAPSAVNATADSDGTQVAVTWTVGEALLRTEIFVRITSGSNADDDVLVESLQPGADRYTLRFLQPSTGYTVSVRHVDAVTGDVTEKATDTVTTGAAPVSLTAPTGERGFVGKQDFAIDVPDEPGVCGIALRSETFPMDMEAYAATETAVGSGSYGDYGYINRVPVRQGTWTPIYTRVPNDGKRRQFKARLVRSGMHRGAAAMSVAEMAALTVEEAASLYAGSHTSSFGTAVTVTPYSNTAIQKTSKTIRLGAHAFVPRTSTTPFSRQSTSLCRTLSTDIPGFFASLDLPQGAHLTAFRMAGGPPTGVTIGATLWKGGGVSGGTNLSTIGIAGSGGALQTDSDSLDITLDGSDFSVAIQFGGSGGPNTTEFLYCEFDYTTPFLDVSL